MTIVADIYPHVVGVDTHARSHTFAILSRGRLVDTQTFPTNQAGLARAVDWIGRRTAGEISGTVVSAEGTSSYGAQLAGMLAEHGYRVVEAPTPHRGRDGKTDALDAQRAARGVIDLEDTALRDHRRHGDLRDAIAALSTLRAHYTDQRTALINMLTALLRVTDLGIDARGPLTATQITQIAGWRPRREPEPLHIQRQIAIAHARDIGDLDRRLAANKSQLADLTARHSPQLLDIYGVGPVSAAVIIAAWSHPGRVRSEAAFAKLAGVCPIPASSGNTTRHRLNRGGDRRLNWALHQIITTRLSHDPRTKAYVARREAEGKTPKEIRRCLKRYLAREIYRTLTASLDNT
jgi:transposase